MCFDENERFGFRFGIGPRFTLHSRYSFSRMHRLRPKSGHRGLQIAVAAWKKMSELLKLDPPEGVVRTMHQEGL